MSSAFALPYHCNRMWQPIGSTFPTSHAPFPFALDVAVSSKAVKVRFVEVSSPSRNLTDIMFCYAESHRSSVCSSAIHCASRRAINRPTTNLRPYCSCPIHRALEIVCCSDESPNYRTLSVQLRESYILYCRGKCDFSQPKSQCRQKSAQSASSASIFDTVLGFQYNNSSYRL